MKIYKVKLDPSNPIEKLVKVPVGEEYGIQISWDYDKYKLFTNSSIDTQNGFLVNSNNEYACSIDVLEDTIGTRNFLYADNSTFPILNKINDSQIWFYNSTSNYEKTENTLGSIKIVAVDKDNFDIDLGSSLKSITETELTSNQIETKIINDSVKIESSCLDGTLWICANNTFIKGRTSLHLYNYGTTTIETPDLNLQIGSAYSFGFNSEWCDSTQNSEPMLYYNGSSKAIADIVNGGGSNYFVEWSDQWGNGWDYFTIGFKPDIDGNNMYDGDHMLNAIYIGSETETYIGTACLYKYNTDYGYWEYITRRTQNLFLESDYYLEIEGVQGFTYYNGIYINCSDPGNTGWYTYGNYYLGVLTINSQCAPVLIANYCQDWYDSSYEQGVHICTNNGYLKFCIDTNNGFGWKINGYKIDLDSFLNSFGSYEG